MARRTPGIIEGSRLVLVVLCALALVLALLDSRDSVVTRGLRAALRWSMVPATATVHATTDPVASFFADWRTVGSKNARIAELQAANNLLRERLALSDDVLRRNRELDALLQLTGSAEVRIVAGRITAVGATQSAGKTVLLDIGKNDGVRVNMNVVAGGGLVGRVTSVGNSTAVVTLIIDASSTVGARLEGTGEIGFISGMGRTRELQLQLIDPYAELQVGDRLVSFGVKGGVYGSGYPIGEVTGVRGKAGTSTRVADVRPFVNMGALDVVGVVVVKQRTDPRDSLLPAKPTPTPTPVATPQDEATPIASPSASATGENA